MTVMQIARARADREDRFLIARRGRQFAVYERGADGLLAEVHQNAISREAADRLRNDLMAKRCPINLETNPANQIAYWYEVAVHIVPLLEGVADPWSVALRIAHAEPWLSRCDASELPF